MSKAGELKACQEKGCSNHHEDFDLNCHWPGIVDLCPRYWRAAALALQERAENAEYNFGVQLDETKALQERVRELEDYKADIENATKTATDEECTANEKHCTCVPLLRNRVRELEGLLRHIEAEAIEEDWVIYNEDGDEFWVDMLIKALLEGKE